MSLTLTAFNIGTQTFSVCANTDDVVWRNLGTNSYGYVEDFNYPLVTIERYTREDYFTFDPTTQTIITYNGPVLSEPQPSEIATIRIPSEINNISVNTIGPEVFKTSSTEYQYLTSITIYDNISSIRENCFSGDPNLKNIRLPIGISAIEIGTFRLCTSLPSIILPSHISQIKDNAFNGCTNLTAIYFQGNAPILGDGTFASSPLVTAFRLSGTTGWDTWSGPITALWVNSNLNPNFNESYSWGLTSLYTNHILNVSATIADTKIITLCAYDPTNMHDTSAIIDLLPSHSYIEINRAQYTPESEFGITNTGTISSYTGTGSEVRIPQTINGILPISIVWSVFNGHTEIIKTILPDSLIHTEQDDGNGNGPWKYCTNLTDVIVGKSLTYFNSGAFLHCTNLSSIYFRGNAPFIANYVFLGTPPPTAYWLEGTTGWNTWTATPTAKWVDSGDPIDNSILAIASYQQVSSLTLSNIPSNYILTWKIDPFTSNLTANGQPFIAPISGLVQDLRNLSIYTDSVTPIVANLTLSISGSPFLNSPYASSVSPTQQLITFNDLVKVQVLSTFGTGVILSTYQYDAPVDAAKQLVWNIVPSTGVTLSAINYGTTIPINTQTSALCAGHVAFFITDYTKEYDYSLSSIHGVSQSDTPFRPYIDMSRSVALTAQISAINLNQQEQQYYIQIYGLSGYVPSPNPFYYNAGIPYSLNNFDYLVWQNTTANSNIFAIENNGDSYNFDIQKVSNIDKLHLNLNPKITTTYPKLCTYSFMVCALTGVHNLDAVLNTTFTLTANEWLDSNVFTPRFNIQYEPIDLLTVYRPLTTASYLISSNSILPPNSKGNFIFTFDDVVSTIPYDLTTGNNPPTAFYHTFDGHVPALCTISLVVQTSAAGYQNYFSRSANTRYIQFADFPIASASLVLPEFTWDNNTWGCIVSSFATNNGIILSANIPLTAYGLCHTENYFVSSQSTTGTNYNWTVYDAHNNLLDSSTNFISNTGWLSIVSPAATETYTLSVAIFTNLLPTSMPTKYYDNINGQAYSNFSSKTIYYYGVDSTVIPDPPTVDPNPIGIPSDIYLTFTNGIKNSPFSFDINSLSFSISTNYLSTININGNASDSPVNYVAINVDDIGNHPLNLPKYDVNEIIIQTSNMLVSPTILSLHPLANDWCFAAARLLPYTTYTIVTANPVVPLIYTPNRYVLTGTNVVFENLANYYTGIQDFVWTDRDNTLTVTTCVPYVTNFNTIGPKDLTLVTHFSSNHQAVVELENSFKDIVVVQSSFETYNSDINRIFGVTVLDLPNDETIVPMGANDFITADTFNSCMTKLYNNLVYLKNMAKLYDNPPTDYFGWLGSIPYTNNSKHFRWFVDSPNISYAYSEPNLAIDDKFTNLADVFVRNNLMYVSNTTTISVLSSDFKATTIGSTDSKVTGDYFTNVKAIQLDTINRVYVLDGNRIIVFNFDNSTALWTMLYSWGGLGGPSAKGKFNNPNDFYIDKNDIIWVADTDNKVIKKYTRTGSWLQTITSTLFDINPPLSITSDENGYYHILTSSTIIKMDSTGNVIDSKILKYNGAKKIRECKDGNFGYICYKDKIVKYMYSLENQATFAHNDFSYYTADYRSVFHDEYRNLYIVGKNNILKYIDKLSLVTLIQDTESKSWPLENLFVSKEEYIQDWVVNRSLDRMYDNIEILRKSILGKFTYQTISHTVTSSALGTLTPPDDFDYCNEDWLYNGRYPILTTTEVVRPIVRSFTLDEYKELPYTKDDIFIGLNELVSAPVINRPLLKLLECQETIREMLS